MTRHQLVLFGRRLGLEIRRYRPTGRRRVELLHRHGIGIVLDVGANVGDYALELRRFGYEGRIVSIEPYSEAARQLEGRARADDRWEVVRAAVGNDDGIGELNVASNTASSSLLPFLESHRRAAPDVRFVARETVDVKTIDSLGVAFDRPALLKLDVQGYENRVLAGASDALQHVALIECELCVVPNYESQLGLHAMLDLLGDLGFRLFLLDPGGRGRDGETWFYNAFLERA
jgi:FkbM family methyltransferase